MTTFAETAALADPAALADKAAGAAPAPVSLVELRTSSGWFAVCATGDLEPGRGVAALLPDGAQAAVFKGSDGRLHAVDNIDPFTGAGVLCHGLLGSVSGRPYVASPLLKQRFDLEDGRCLDDDEVSVTCYPLRVVRPDTGAVGP